MASVSDTDNDTVKSPATGGIMGLHKGHCQGDKKCTDVPPSGDTQQVCQSCQHLYRNNGEMVLSPATLITTTPAHNPTHTAHTPTHTPTQTPPPTHTEHTHTTSILRTPLKLWTPRRYGGLCECGSEESGGRGCQCNRTPWHRPLHSATTSYWPRVKVALLVIAAIIPFAFLIAYLVLTYTL